MTQETSPDFAHPLKTLIAPYIPKDEAVHAQTRSMIVDALDRSAKESKNRDWDSMSAETQITAVTGKMLPIGRLAQAAVLLSDSDPRIQSWTEGDKRSFVGKVIDVEKNKVNTGLKNVIPYQTDPLEVDSMRERALRRINEYDTLLAKLQARATPNGPARR